MSELRNYILSKLQEMTDQTPAEKPTPRRKPTSKSAEAAAKAAKKSKFGEIFAKINAGPSAPLPPKPKPKPEPKPENSSTDLRTQLAYVLADKLEELSQETMDSAAIRRTDMLRGGHRGRQVPIYRGGTGKTDEPEIIGTRTTAGTGVIQGRLQGRKATPDRPAKPSLYAGKITPGVTGKEGRAKFFAARAKEAGRENSSTNLRTQLMYVLADKIDEIIIDRKNEKLVNPFKPEPSDKPETPDLSRFSTQDTKLTDKLKKIIRPKPSPESLLVPSKSPLFMGKK